MSSVRPAKNDITNLLGVDIESIKELIDEWAFVGRREGGRNCGIYPP